MTPEPTPVSGITPRSPPELPVTLIFTTAGLTLAATAMVADDSSMATGWTVPAFVACGNPRLDAAGRSSAPAAPSARTVPPDARTADNSDAARIEPGRGRVRAVWATEVGAG